MKIMWSLLISLAMATPAFAQDDPFAEEESGEYMEPAEGEEAAEETTGETAEEPAEETSGEASDESYYDTVPVDVPEEEEEPSDPWALYGAVDYVQSTFSSSHVPGFGARDYDSGMYRLKFGTRIFEKKVGLEFHYGINAGSDKAGEVETDSYYGLFVVPRGTVLDLFEVALPIGYAKSSVAGGGNSADLDSVAYGLDVQLPLKLYSEDLPDLRFGLGWMIYYQKNDARMYGANLGVRYDFTSDAIGNPFTGVGDWFSDLDLWPFNDE